MNGRYFIATVVAFGLCGAHTAQPTFAQELPKQAITLVVGFAPGGAADAAARLIARKLQDNLGQSVVVDNRAGAGGTLRINSWPMVLRTGR